MTTGKSLGLLSLFAAAAVIAYLAVRQQQSTGDCPIAAQAEARVFWRRW